LLARFNGFADAVEQKVDGAAHGMKHRCILEPDDCNDLSPRTVRGVKEKPKIKSEIKKIDLKALFKSPPVCGR